MVDVIVDCLNGKIDDATSSFRSFQRGFFGHKASDVERQSINDALKQICIAFGLKGDAAAALKFAEESKEELTAEVKQTLLIGFIRVGDMKMAVDFADNILSDSKHLFPALTTSVRGKALQSLVEGFARYGDLVSATMWHREMVKDGLELDHWGYRTLIAAHFENGAVEKAESVFTSMQDDGLPVTKPIWTSMANGYLKGGDLRSARDMLNNIDEFDGHSAPVMLQIFLREGRSEEAWELYYAHRDSIIVATIMANYCLRIHNWEGFQRIHDRVVLSKIEDVIWTITMLQSLVNRGRIGESISFFAEVIQNSEAMSIHPRDFFTVSKPLKMSDDRGYRRKKIGCSSDGKETLLRENAQLQTRIADSAIKTRSRRPPAELLVNVIIVALCSRGLASAAWKVVEATAAIGVGLTPNTLKSVMESLSASGDIGGMTELLDRALRSFSAKSTSAEQRQLPLDGGTLAIVFKGYRLVALMENIANITNCGNSDELYVRGRELTPPKARLTASAGLALQRVRDDTLRELGSAPTMRFFQDMELLSKNSAASDTGPAIMSLAYGALIRQYVMEKDYEIAELLFQRALGEGVALRRENLELIGNMYLETNQQDKWRLIEQLLR
ncbi:hypothetical protein HK101_005913 [Irineochytrium annulatum]|nr:hypothetical protein HK101_005913 [Irineochytrium annulatum]